MPKCTACGKELSLSSSKICTECQKREEAGEWWGWLLCVAAGGVVLLILYFAVEVLRPHLGLAKKIAPAAGVTCLVSFVGAIAAYWKGLNLSVEAGKSFDDEEIRKAKPKVDRLMILSAFLGLLSLSCFLFILALLLA
jgi:hypothetical protein